MDASRRVFAWGGWLLAAALTLAHCGESTTDEQLHALVAKQVTVSGNGTVTIADGVVRIVDAQGRVATLDATGVHVAPAPAVSASAGH